MPWGDNNTLHWFGLTHGIYYMNVGDEQLFRSSKEILQKYAKEDPSFDISNIFTDYHVIRLYDDLLEILPNILQEVPPQLYSLVKTSSLQQKWQSAIWDIYESSQSESIEDLCFEADWLSCRKLDVGYLINGPSIWFWRVADDIYIRWDNRVEDDAISSWSSVEGEIKMPVKEFTIQVKSFHDRFMSSMQERIDLIIDKNPIPDIKINIPDLLQEHKYREKSLEDSLKLEPDTLDWDMITKANQTLLDWF